MVTSSDFDGASQDSLDLVMKRETNQSLGIYAYSHFSTCTRLKHYVKVSCICRKYSFMNENIYNLKVSYLNLLSLRGARMTGFKICLRAPH